MTLLSEALRITAKDLRVLRTACTAWSLLLLASVARGLEWLPSLREPLFAVTALVPLGAAILVAMAVSVDPAGSGVTFWRIHHQRPLAIVLAKALLALLLLTLMAIGHAVVLRTHALPWPEVMARTVTAAYEVFGWLIFAAALATCARTAKGLLLGLALVMVLALLLTSVTTDQSYLARVWSLPPAMAASLLVTVSAAMMAWTYRAHLTGVYASVRTALLLVTPAVILVLPRTGNAWGMDDAVRMPDPAVRVHADSTTTRINAGVLIVTVPVAFPDSSDIIATARSWRVHLRDGGTIDLFAGRPHVRRRATPLAEDETLAAWGRGPVRRAVEFRFPLDSAIRSRVERDLRGVSMALTIDRFALHRRTAFLAQQGGAVAHGGVRLRLSPPLEDGRFIAATSYVFPLGERARRPVGFGTFMPVLAVVPHTRGPIRTMIAASRTADEAGMRLPSWVLPAHDMQGYRVPLSVAGTALAPNDTIVALTSDYAGRTMTQVNALAK